MIAVVTRCGFSSAQFEIQHRFKERNVPSFIDNQAAWNRSFSAGTPGYHSFSNPFTLYPLGDFNGDGYEDIALQIDYSEAYVVYGGTSWPNTLVDVMQSSNVAHIFSTTAPATGSAIGSVDFNGDGKRDLLLSTAYQGFLVYGNLYSGEVDLDSLPSTAYFIFTSSAYGVFAAGMGDLNGDGYEEIGVANTLAGNNGFLTIIWGTASAIADPIDLDNPGIYGVKFIAEYASGMGFRVNPIGDINNDGKMDCFIGSDLNKFYILYGGFETANITFPALMANTTNSTYIKEITLDTPSAQFGRYGCGFGDINSDGYDDFGVTAFGYTNGSFTPGAVFIFYGGPDIASSIRSSDIGTQSQVGYFVIIGDPTSNNKAGLFLQGGDVNGDGYVDILLLDRVDMLIGRSYIFYGSPNGWPAVSTEFDYPYTTTIEITSDYNTGDTLVQTLLANVNGDGLDDIVILTSFYGYVVLGQFPSPSVSASVSQTPSISPSTTESPSTSMTPSISSSSSSSISQSPSVSSSGSMSPSVSQTPSISPSLSISTSQTSSTSPSTSESPSMTETPSITPSLSSSTSQTSSPSTSASRTPSASPSLPDKSLERDFYM